MRRNKRKRLTTSGWRVGTTAEFLDLTPEEAAYVELRLALADYLKTLRVRRRWTQTEVATRLKSSQSRVAKMESGDPTVSVDLLVKSLFALGASRKDLGRVIASPAA